MFIKISSFSSIMAEETAIEAPKRQGHGKLLITQVIVIFVIFALFIVYSSQKSNIPLETNSSVGANQTSPDIATIDMISFPQFALGSINKISLSVFNNWTSEMYGISADVVLKNSQNVTADAFTMGPGNIPSLSFGTLDYNWDTTGFDQGNYSFFITLNYNGKAQESRIDTSITQDSVSILNQVLLNTMKVNATRTYTTSSSFFILAIVALVLIDAVLVFFFARKKYQ